MLPNHVYYSSPLNRTFDQFFKFISENKNLTTPFIGLKSIKDLISYVITDKNNLTKLGISTGDTKGVEDTVKPVAAKDSPLPSLPPGWERKVSKSSGKTFYFHAGSGMTLWNPPTADEAAKAAKAPTAAAAAATAPTTPTTPKPEASKDAPPGWERKVSKSTGKTYYFNPSTGSTVFNVSDIPLPETVEAKANRGDGIGGWQQ